MRRLTLLAHLKEALRRAADPRIVDIGVKSRWRAGNGEIRHVAPAPTVRPVDLTDLFVPYYLKGYAIRK